MYRSGKKDEVLGVAAPGQNLWSVGAQPPQDRWYVRGPRASVVI